ncbi:uncharacterized protein LOC8284696 [Ricinus communis]|uniref:uncharacterized protein LOC8284696 n=1 Tax=Ricinus communis TaxID=3988 RepID=UPI00201A5EEB|nr:uncharacterized protein LOC8284696 [Ricinus communis]
MLSSNSDSSALNPFLDDLPEDTLSSSSETTIDFLSYSLISSLNFISIFVNNRINHNACEYQEPSIIILDYRNTQNDQSLFIAHKIPFIFNGFKFDFLPERGDFIKVLGSFNDLLLCGAVKTDYSAFYICNRFTKQWISLPLLKNCKGDDHFGLICEPFYSRSAKQSEYTINAEYRYRVVCFTEIEKGNVIVRTYVSEICAWKAFLLYGGDYQFCSNVVAHNGKLHWFNGLNVVAYDPFNDEKICYINGSEIQPNVEMLNSYYLGVSQGVLKMTHLVSTIYFNGDGDDIENLSIWELKDYETGHWNLEHRIYSFNAKSNGFRDGTGICDPVTLAFNPTDKDTVYLKFGQEVMLCDLQGEKLQLAGEIPKGIGCFDGDKAFPVMLPWWPTPVHVSAHP